MQLLTWQLCVILPDVTTFPSANRAVIVDTTAFSYFNRTTEPLKSETVRLLRIVCAVLVVNSQTTTKILIYRGLSKLSLV